MSLCPEQATTMATSTHPLGWPSSRLSLCLSWQPGAAAGADIVLDTGVEATALVRFYSPAHQREVYQVSRNSHSVVRITSPAISMSQLRLAKPLTSCLPAISKEC